MSLQRALPLGLLLGIFCPPLFAAPADSAPASGPVFRAMSRRLPWSLRFSGEERVRLESLGGIGFLPSSDTLALQRLRLNVDLAPARWLRFAFQLQDSRGYFGNVRPAPASQKDRADLRVAYVQVGDSETSILSLRAGRQSLVFGEGRVLADPNWSNVGRAFDAVRLTFRYRGVRLDAFSGASDKIDPVGFDRPVPGQHVHGVYGSFDSLIPGAVVEPYVIWRLEHNVKAERGPAGKLSEKVIGLRCAGKLPRAWDYSLEIAGETGSLAGDRVIAWGSHAVLGYTFALNAHRPRGFIEINRATGDQNPGDGIHGAFDPLFPSAHDKFGVADQFLATNVLHARSGYQYRFRPNLSMTAAYNSFWLANRRDGIYSGSKLSIASNGRGGNHIGQEADLQLQWSPARYTAVEAAYGRIFPGGFLRTAGRQTPYHCLLLSIAQRF